MNSTIQNMNILIVKDEHLLREMLSDVLTKEGYKTFEAGNSDEALNLVENTNIDLAIIDYKMPGGPIFQNKCCHNGDSAAA